MVELKLALKDFDDDLEVSGLEVEWKFIYHIIEVTTDVILVSDDRIQVLSPNNSV